MKCYELTYLISSELKTEKAEELALEISAFLQNKGGSIIKTENPKPKTLSYQIKKQGTAFQVNLEFCSTPERLKTLEEKIKKDLRILRYLIIVKKPLQKEREEKRIPIAKPSRISRFQRVSSTESGLDSDFIESPRQGRDKVRTESAEKKVELKDIEEKLEEILKE